MGVGGKAPDSDATIERTLLEVAPSQGAIGLRWLRPLGQFIKTIPVKGKEWVLQYSWETTSEVGKPMEDFIEAKGALGAESPKASMGHGMEL